MQILDISIIGLGLIGGSIAKALKKSRADINISAFDRKEVLQSALNDKVIEKELKTIDEALNSDIVFLCLPVDLSLKIFKELAPRLKENTILTDVCGVKSVFHEEWEKIKCKGMYIGGHPMTGKEKGGYENSDHLLFENSIYILTGCEYSDNSLDEFFRLIKSLGARVTCVDSDLHDRIVANVSHLPQLLSVSLVNTSTKDNSQRNYTDFAAGGFRDMTRIASSDFGIWEPVIKSNKSEILSALSNLHAELDEIKKMVEFENYQGLAKKFEEARIKRDEIPIDTKGFLTPLYDIFVYVQDKPGVIMEISTALAQHNINIKDIELLKIREGSGGTFRLSFDSEHDADEAKLYLKSAGYETK